MSEVREKYFLVYCIKGCRKIPKQENRSFVIIQGSEKIAEYAEKNSLCAVPGLVSRLMYAEQIFVLTDVRQVVEEQVFFFSPDVLTERVD